MTKMPVVPSSAFPDLPRRILVIRPDAIGDVMLMIPFLNSLKASIPSAEIYTLQREYTAALLTEHPAVTVVILDQKKHGLRADAARIRAYGFDWVFLPFLEPYYAMLCWMAGIPVRVGDGQKIALRPFLTHPVALPFRRVTLHEVEQYDFFLKAVLCQPVYVRTTGLVINDAARVSGEAVLYSRVSQGDRLIGIHPSSGGGNRAWLPSHYAQLIDCIHSRTSYRVVLTGSGQKDAEIVVSILSQCTTAPVSLVNATSLAELMVIISHFDMMIGTDTGPTHIAASFRVPVLSISPTKFVKSLRWGPWQTLNRISGNASACPLVCAPYVCRATFCLELLGVETVYRAFQQLLADADQFGSIEADALHLRNRMLWFEASMNALIYVRSLDDLDWAAHLAACYRSTRMSIWIACHSPRLCTELIDRLVKMGHRESCVVLCHYHMPAWLSLIWRHDITVIHTRRPLARWFEWSIRQLAALRLYVPPRFMGDMADVVTSGTLSEVTSDRLLGALVEEY